MSIKVRKRECYYHLVQLTDSGDVHNPNEKDERDGYFEFWGQSSSVIWENGTPYIKNFIAAVVTDKETGQVYVTIPDFIRFKNNDNRANK